MGTGNATTSRRNAVNKLGALYGWEKYKNGTGYKCPKGYVVHHKDGNPFNNELDNLEVMTEYEHMLLHGLVNKPFKCVETGVIYNSTREAEKLTGIKRNGIKFVLKGKRHTAGGFHWSYI